MSEYRQDAITGAWVIIAPERGGRPRLGVRAAGADSPASAQPAHDPACPFCPGNEHMLPEIIEEVPGKGPPGWQTRVVANKFPAVSSSGGAARPAGVGGIALPGHGAHEVIVETPRHDAELTSIGSGELAGVLRACRRRHAALIERPGIQAVVVFRNRGEHGGASVPHPHSQVVATGIVPPRLAAAAAWAREQHARHGECVTCAALAHELGDGRRVVEVSGGFAALVPFAAASPFEQHIVPRRHLASFHEATDAELAGLARLLQRSLWRLATALDDPPYNLVIDSAPAGDVSAPHAHWGLRIFPRRTRLGGFELGSGMPINASLPESDAATLRSVALPDGEGNA